MDKSQSGLVNFRIKDLEGKTNEELYNIFEIIKQNYLNTKKIDDLKKLKEIKKYIDNLDLNDEQLDQIKVRSKSYKSYPDYNNPNFIKEISSKREFYYNKRIINQNQKDKFL